MSEQSHVDSTTVPRWARGVRLRFDEARDLWVLMAPERILMPDGVALDIMRRIDGECCVEEIVDELADEYVADREEMSAETVEFIGDLVDRGLVKI